MVKHHDRRGELRGASKRREQSREVERKIASGEFADRLTALQGSSRSDLVSDRDRASGSPLGQAMRKGKKR